MLENVVSIGPDFGRNVLSSQLTLKEEKLGSRTLKKPACKKTA